MIDNTEKEETAIKEAKNPSSDTYYIKVGNLLNIQCDTCGEYGLRYVVNNNFECVVCLEKYIVKIVHEDRDREEEELIEDY